KRMFEHLIKGDEGSAAAHRRFYDEYLAVMDVPASYYLQTVETFFQKHDLATGNVVVVAVGVGGWVAVLVGLDVGLTGPVGVVVFVGPVVGLVVLLEELEGGVVGLVVLLEEELEGGVVAVAQPDTPPISTYLPVPEAVRS
ncbi:MAG: hypothetical protein ABI384_00825, partial [Allobranchiibius sp.]